MDGWQWKVLVWSGWFRGTPFLETFSQADPHPSHLKRRGYDRDDHPSSKLRFSYVCWFINPINTKVIGIINHTYWDYVYQLKISSWVSLYLVYCGWCSMQWMGFIVVNQQTQLGSSTLFCPRLNASCALLDPFIFGCHIVALGFLY